MEDTARLIQNAFITKIPEYITTKIKEARKQYQENPDTSKRVFFYLDAFLMDTISNYYLEFPKRIRNASAENILEELEILGVDTLAILSKIEEHLRTSEFHRYYHDIIKCMNQNDPHKNRVYFDLY